MLPQRPTPRTLLLLRLLLGLTASLWSTDGLAHHSAAHGGSDTLRALGTSGTNPAPRQRVALLLNIGRSSAEPALSVQTSETVSALVDYQIGRAWFVGATLPFGLVQEDLTTGSKVGLGNLQLRGQFALSQKEGVAPTIWSLGLSFGIPTRTVTYEVDPGRQWGLTPNVRYASGRGRLLWYALMMVPWDLRPAGAAMDLSPAVGVGYRFLKGFSMSAGMSADVRLLNLCRTTEGTSFCPDGRDTEANRPIGATRLYIVPALTLDIASQWSLLASSQIPLLPHRDIEWQFSVGVEARF